MTFWILYGSMSDGSGSQQVNFMWISSPGDKPSFFHPSVQVAPGFCLQESGQFTVSCPTDEGVLFQVLLNKSETCFFMQF